MTKGPTDKSILAVGVWQRKQLERKYDAFKKLGK
jgi:hypothetical protein